MKIIKKSFSCAIKLSKNWQSYGIDESFEAELDINNPLELEEYEQTKKSFRKMVRKQAEEERDMISMPKID